MKVEALEDLAEGFSNAFNEESKVKIEASVENLIALHFDQDFGNIPFKAEITVRFYNPIDERFLAALAKVAVKGTAEVSATDSYQFSFSIVSEKAKVQQFETYFLTETTLQEFEQEYLSVLQEKVF